MSCDMLFTSARQWGFDIISKIGKPHPYIAAKSKICNACSAQVFNGKINSSDFIDTLKPSTFTKNPTFRIFIDFHHTPDLNSAPPPQTESTTPIEPNPLAQFRNNILQSVQILRGNTFTEFCRKGCTTITKFHDFPLNADLSLGRFNLDDEHVTLPMFNQIVGKISSAELPLVDSICMT
ncbi:hypothetical protein Fcan01_22736 [Folsomia candida]|uniref:Uncharacterized protein n=1 Tax=Folsomia candida TaxID=158441 RepID=A0A226DC65_FOLCA|nr:hypothetical protein Fcan01_22736 [Folsomia candida]